MKTSPQNRPFTRQYANPFVEPLKPVTRRPVTNKDGTRASPNQKHMKKLLLATTVSSRDLLTKKAVSSLAATASFANKPPPNPILKPTCFTAVRFTPLLNQRLQQFRLRKPLIFTDEERPSQKHSSEALRSLAIVSSTTSKGIFGTVQSPCAKSAKKPLMNIYKTISATTSSNSGSSNTAQPEIDLINKLLAERKRKTAQIKADCIMTRLNGYRCIQSSITQQQPRPEPAEKSPQNGIVKMKKKKSWLVGNHNLDVSGIESVNPPPEEDIGDIAKEMHTMFHLFKS